MTVINDLDFNIGNPVGSYEGLHFLQNNTASLPNGTYHYLKIPAQGSWQKGFIEGIDFIIDNQIMQPDDFLIADFSIEGHAKINKITHNRLQKLIQISGCRPKNIFLASQTDPALRPDLKESHFAEYSWLPLHGFLGMVARDSNANPKDDLHFNDLATKVTRFMCLNRRLRDHRLLFLELLQNSEIADSIYLSRLNLPSRNIPDEQAFGPEAIAPAKQKLKQIFPSFADVIDNIDLARNMEKGLRLEEKTKDNPERTNLITTLPESAAINTHVALVTETDFLQFFTRVTEKTLKPIAYHRPFIILGCYGSLSYLKEYGFNTFSPFINESYDLIQDRDERLRAVFNETIRLHRALQDNGFKSEFVSGLRDICAHNQKHLRENFLDIMYERAVYSIHKQSQPALKTFLLKRKLRKESRFQK